MRGKLIQNGSAPALAAMIRLHSFSAAALHSPALDTMGPPNNTSTVPRAVTTSVSVPAGNYTLASMVDVGSKAVTWVLDPGAKITGSDFINGRTTREGLKVTHGHPFGILDNAGAFTTTLGGGYSDKPAPLTGVANPAALANYPNYDAAALVSAAYSYPALADVASAAYGSLTATVPLLSHEQRLRLRRGMIIETKHVPAFIGVVDSWVHTATTTVLTVKDGWYIYRNSSAGTQLPANSVGLRLSPVTKIWGSNFVTNLTSGGAAKHAIGCEISNRNLRSDSGYDPDVDGDRVWGFLAASVAEGTAGHFRSQAAFIARGWWGYGLVADNQDIGYYYKTTGAAKTAIKTRMAFGATIMDCEDTTNGRRYRITGMGDTAHGDPAVVAGLGRSILFHTSGLGAPYDARINATGGSASPGQGTLAFSAVNNVFGGTVRPTQDNVFASGSASFRWSTVFAGSGTINTSDERLKTDIGSIPNDWLDAWGDVEWRRYKFTDAVEQKGDAARWHTGLIAQQIERAFAARGLDAFEIGLLCKDRVMEKVTVTVEESRAVMEDVEVDYLSQEIEVSCIVQRRAKRIIQRQKQVNLPIVDEEGEPVMEEVLDPDAPQGEDRRRIIVPMVRAVPVMETVSVEREVERETDGWRYGVRYTEALAMEAEWVRREMKSKPVS